MFIFFERRIVVRRQHFGVCVNIDASVRGLLEQHLEVTQIVAGDENARRVPTPRSTVVISGLP